MLWTQLVWTLCWRVLGVDLSVWMQASFIEEIRFWILSDESDDSIADGSASDAGDELGFRTCAPRVSHALIVRSGSVRVTPSISAWCAVCVVCMCMACSCTDR